MASKKPAPKSYKPAFKPAAKVVAKPSSTPVRNTTVPKSQPASSKREITQDMIARRAYEISQSPQCGSEYDNWIRAERELRGGR